MAALPIASCERAVDHPAPAITLLAPSTFTSAKVTTRLEAHIGLTVAAAAAALGAAMGEKFKNGAVNAPTKAVGGETIAALLKLYFFMAANVDFARIARERGVEVLVENDVPLGAAEFLVDEVLKILAAVTRNQLN
jgi:hypothetical protein